jgi:hypothetical protein
MGGFTVVAAGTGRPDPPVTIFCVLLVPETSGVPFLGSLVSDELPFVGDLITVQDTLAQVTHVWPGDDGPEVRAITLPALKS